MSEPSGALDPSTPGEEERRILANTAVMAAGTVVSRFSGFVRSMLLAAALGISVRADVFTIANTVPNMLYILLAGGVFNAVLVPQLVRAMRTDDDGGAAYVDRVMTLALLFLGTVTVLLVVVAPLLMDLLLSNQCTAGGGTTRASAVDLARYCLPQVFFYGMFVLVGQVLNARGRFGPMMWAPIANNLIAIAVLVAYLVVYGAATTAEQRSGFTSGQELLLGVGSTIGIAAQLLILVPYLRSAGVRYRPRFDVRGVGLGQTFRLGLWTVLFVIVNQIAYVVVVRLASSGTACDPEGTGITVYSSVMLVVMVPHSIITVSLATAILPRLSARAAEDDLVGLGRTLAGTLRTALAVVVPVAAVMPAVALPAAQVIWGHGATASTYPRFEPSLILFSIGLIAFTVHYLVLRAFYALERNRTVFFVQCAIAATNIALAVLLVGAVDAAATAPALIVAYSGAYALGAVVSTTLLRRAMRASTAAQAGAQVDDRETASSTAPAWTSWTARLLLASAVAGGTAALTRVVVGDTVDRLVADPAWWWAALELAVIAPAAAAALLVSARVLRIAEVTSVVASLTGRLRR